MPFLAIISAAALALCAAIWSSSAVGLALGTTVKVILSAAVAVVWVAVGAVALVRSRQAASRAQASLSKTMMRSASGLAEMNDQFQKCLGALRSTRPAALNVLPWYLVLGAPGSGKTTMLSESG